MPVPRSLADTLTMPFASISNVTSICGTPRGAGGIPTFNEIDEENMKTVYRLKINRQERNERTNENCPKSLLLVAMSRSPW